MKVGKSAGAMPVVMGLLMAGPAIAADAAGDGPGKVLQYVPQEHFTFETAPEPESGFVWSVDNNFRILSSQKEQDRYYKDLTHYYPYAQAMRCWGHDLKSMAHCGYKGAIHPGLAHPTDRNYSTQWRPSLAQYAPGWAIDPKRNINLSFKSSDPKLKCSWTLDGKPVAKTGCGIQVATMLGKHNVGLVTISPSGARQTQAYPVDIKDVLILALGDSFGAGEGAPTVLKQTPWPAQWMDKRCHNSLYAGFPIAAARYARMHPQESVTFLTYACSGAEIDGDTADFHGGILTPYWGRETATQVETDYRLSKMSVPEAYRPFPGDLPPQLGRARQALCPPASFDGATWTCHNGLHSPDFIFVSTGGNEMDFGPQIMNVALTLGGCKTACMDKIADLVKKDIARLSGRYDRLGAELKKFEKPAPIFLTQYGDPVKDEKGHFCDDSAWSNRPIFFSPDIESIPFLGFGVKSKPVEFTYNKLLGTLNEAQEKAAIKNGWIFLSGMQEATSKKGYCSRRRSFQPYDVSQEGQGVVPIQHDVLKTAISTGAMHPNMFGYSAMGDSVFHAMNAVSPP